MPPEPERRVDITFASLVALRASGAATRTRLNLIDFLGLGMLSAVEECVDLIERHRDKVIDLSRIPFDDAAVFEDISRGDTVGVFQIESRAQIAMLPRTQPRTLDDLTVKVSIVRPGRSWAAP